MGKLIEWPKREPKENPRPYTTVNVLADAYAAYNKIALSGTVDASTALVVTVDNRKT